MPHIQPSNGDNSVSVVPTIHTKLPKLIVDAGDQACRRYIEFFTANIRNRNTREAYVRAVTDFARWCEHYKLRLEQLSPPLVAAYIEKIGTTHSVPTVKQHLAAVRMLMDYLVVGQVIGVNPAASVGGPKHVVHRGKTPVLSAKQARALLDSIDTSTLVGLRDRALIGVMVYSFARVSAVIGMKGDDYYTDGKRWWFRLHEKGGRFHEVPAHHKAEAYLDEYLRSAAISFKRSDPLFRPVNRRGELTDRRLDRREVLAMVKRRARVAGIPDRIGCHTWRATGITSYLLGGGTLERAQQIAAHSSAKTTKLYDRRNDEITLDEIERIQI
jgi:site-specific recombinase XerD